MLKNLQRKGLLSRLGGTGLDAMTATAIAVAAYPKKGFETHDPRTAPTSHNTPFDLVMYRKESGVLERVQVKYTESDGKVVVVHNESKADWVHYRYTAQLVDWLAVYDATTARCYYIPSSTFDGMCRLNLRLTSPANNQKKLIRWAEDFLEPHVGNLTTTAI